MPSMSRVGYADRMTSLSYRGHRFPASIIQHAIWLYFRFSLSYRDVEELLAERGLDLSYETIRRWVLIRAETRATAATAAPAVGRPLAPR
jgi:transposase-like protein